MKAILSIAAVLLSLAAGARGQTKAPPDFEPPIALERISSPIQVDGDLSDPGWRDVTLPGNWEMAPA